MLPLLPSSRTLIRLRESHGALGDRCVTTKGMGSLVHQTMPPQHIEKHKYCELTLLLFPKFRPGGDNSQGLFVDTAAWPLSNCANTSSRTLLLCPAVRYF